MSILDRNLLKNFKATIYLAKITFENYFFIILFTVYVVITDRNFL